MFVLSDIVIGNFPISQNFGARPEVYNARYGLKGHTGIDIACPEDTQALAPADGIVQKIGIEALGTFDAGGYGRYILLKHDGFLTRQAHLNNVTVKMGDHVVKGQLIAHTGKTGNTDSAHDHFEIMPCDANGAKTEASNGYNGCIDPLGDRVKWEITNPSSPVLPGGNDQETTIPVKTSDFTTLVSQSTNYKNIASYLIDKGLNGYLAANNRTIIDFNTNPNDPVGGESCVIFLSALMQEIENLESDLRRARESVPSPLVTENIAAQIDTLPLEKKAGLLKTLLNKFLDFSIEGRKQS